MKHKLLWWIVIVSTLLVTAVAIAGTDRQKADRKSKADIPEASIPKAIIPKAVIPKAIIPKAIIPKAIIPKAPDIPEISIPEVTHPGVKVRENEEWAIITLSSDVLFDFDKWNIRPDAQEALQEILKALTGRYGGLPFQIHGHTDAKGTDAYNMKLSKRRADAVKTWFVAHGIPAKRITTFAHGESQPVAPNTKKDGSDNPAGRQLNRRVEIYVRKRVREK